MANVKVVLRTDSSVSRVEIDGKPMEDVTHIIVSQRAGEPPKVTLELWGADLVFDAETTSEHTAGFSVGHTPCR